MRVVEVRRRLDVRVENDDTCFAAFIAVDFDAVEVVFDGAGSRGCTFFLLRSLTGDTERVNPSSDPSLDPVASTVPGIDAVSVKRMAILKQSTVSKCFRLHGTQIDGIVWLMLLDSLSTRISMSEGYLKKIINKNKKTQLTRAPIALNQNLQFHKLRPFFRCHQRKSQWPIGPLLIL